MKTSRTIPIAAAVMAMGALIAGCASSGPAEAQVTPVQGMTWVPIQVAPVQPDAMPAIEVRLAKPGEVTAAWPNTAQGFAAGAGMSVIALGASLVDPLLAGAVAAWPVMTISGISNDVNRSVLLKALKDADLPRQIEQRTARRFSRRLDSSSASHSWKVEVLLLGYGFLAPAGQWEYSLSVDAKVRLIKDGALVYEDTIYLEPARRSRDAPIPQIRPLDRFAAHDAELANDALLETAEVIAAMISARLTGAP